MAVYSMTGYASVQHSVATPSTAPEARPNRIGLEIRSVNSRFLDLGFKLPDDLRQHEPALRELLTAGLKRGKVEVRAAIEATATQTVSEPSAKLLQRLSSVQDNVRTWLPEAGALSVADVLRLCVSEAPTTASVDWSETVTTLARQALDALRQAREREGARLANMLQGHVKQLRALAVQAQPLVPQLVALQRQRFLERWQEAMGLAQTNSPVAQTGASLPEAAQDRAFSEATAFAIRIDVAEEITRLASHLDEIERLLTQGGEIGKRLDFLIQELHREANTLGSKSAALEMTRVSVDMKVLIEQMREQVQNIE